MKVYLDDELVTTSSAALSGALEACRTAAETKGRVIVEVWADGEPAPAEDIEEPPNYEPYADELKLVTAEPKAFVRHVLQDAADVLSQAQQDQTAAAEGLQTGDIGPALKRMGAALQVWDAVRRAVEEGAALLGVVPEKLRGEGHETVAALAADLNKQLLEVRRCVQGQDWAALGDVLAYDLDEQAQRWQASLSAMAKTLDVQEETP